MQLGLQKLSSNVILNVFRRVAKLVLGLGLYVLLARILGPEGNGTYAVAILLPSLLSTFLNLGVAPANVYYVGRRDVSVRTAFSTSIVLWMLLSVAGFVIGSVVIWFQGDNWFPGVPSYFLWLTLSVFPLVLLQKLLLGLLQAVQDFKRYNSAMLIAPTITLTLATLAVWVFDGGVLGALLAFGVGNLIGSIGTGWILRPRLWKEGDEYEGLWHYVQKCIGYGWKAHLSNVLAFVNYRADLFLVNYFIAPAAAGLYIVAIQIAERLWILSSAVSTVILPRLSELHTEEEKRKYLTPLISRWVLLATLAACLLLALVAYPAVHLLFGEEYIQAVGVLYWFLPGIVVGSGARVLANDIAARGRPELNLYTSLLVVVVNVMANILLIPSMGITGAALATTLAYSLNGIAKVWLYAYLSDNSWWKPLLPNREDLKLLRQAWLLFRRRHASSPNI